MGSKEAFNLAVQLTASSAEFTHPHTAARPDYDQYVAALISKNFDVVKRAWNLVQEKA